MPLGTDVEALASTLNTMLEGMSLQAGDGIGRAELNRVAATVMALLPGKKSNRRLPRSAEINFIKIGNMAKFVIMGRDGIEPQEYGPDKESIISGNPRFRLWSLDEAKAGLSSGIWEATPGKWRFENAHWEYCRILAGVSVIAEEGGTAHTVRAGDSFILSAGFSGTWEVIETTRKDDVIRA